MFASSLQELWVKPSTEKHVITAKYIKLTLPKHLKVYS